MTKKVWAVMTAVILCLTLTVAVGAVGNTPRLNDAADLLSAEQESVLLERLNSVSETYKVDVVVATVDSIGESDVETYAEAYFDQNGFGVGNYDGGVLLLVSMEYSDYCVWAEGLGGVAVSQEEGDSIGETVAASLSAENYADAFHDFVDECEYQIDGEINGFPFNFGKNLLIALVIGLVLAMIITGVWKGQLKSVHKQQTATQYTKPGSMQVTYSNELFLYRTVSTRRKEKSSSSGSSGSSGHASSGKF